MARKVRGPKCKHKRAGIVTSHPAGPPIPLSDGHASTVCCDRPDCIADAIEWASMISHRPAEFVPDQRLAAS